MLQRDALHPRVAHILFIAFVHVSVLVVLFLVRLTCASWHKKPVGRVPAVLVCFPGFGMHPSVELVQSWLAPSNQPPAKRIGVPQWALSVLCSTTVLRSTSCLGASGVYKFLIFAPPTPPQDLIAGILSTHVRCTNVMEPGQR